MAIRPTFELFLAITRVTTPPSKVKAVDVPCYWVPLGGVKCEKPSRAVLASRPMSRPKQPGCVESYIQYSTTNGPATIES